MIDISIIIVTYNHEKEIIKCLKSLFTSLSSSRSQVIIVDNSSSDQTVANAQTLQHRFEPLHEFLIIKNSFNEGFTHAVNQGLIKSNGDYILNLNPDTELTPGIFPVLKKSLTINRNSGVVSPQFLNTNKTIQPSCRRFPRHRDLFYNSMGLNILFPKSKEFNYWKMGDFNFETQQKVEQPQGAFLLTHRTALEQVGLLDESFPMFFSDVDWCRRFINKGWDILFIPEVKIIHHQGSSVFKNRIKMIWSSHRSFYDYFIKYYPGKKWCLINSCCMGLLLCLALLRSLFQLLKENYIYPVKP